CMDGGNAYKCVSKCTLNIMKDIADAALYLGMKEASGFLERQLKRKRIDGAKMAKTLSSIRTTLNYGDFGNVDVVVEAVVENEKVKKAVLAETEAELKDGAVLASKDRKSVV